MSVNDDLGTRVKEFYEQVPKFKLYRRTPVAIRIDGKAFHTFTRGFQKPFDEVLIKSMQNTMKYLCENIQGCVLGYTQSDEITLILIDYKKLTSSAWFDYEVQKMCSIAASMATMAFNKFFYNETSKYWREHPAFRDSEEWKINNELLDTHMEAINKGAMFDARVFNIPKEEVANLIYWRQLDATRNSIQMVSQANFSHKELQNKSCNDIQDMLMLQKGINWNDFPTHQKRGSCCIKNHDYDEYGNDWGEGWRIDTEIPIFKGEGREYINRCILYEERLDN
jgi:tRNA(His) 5'-end guanylyltransferase